MNDKTRDQSDELRIERHREAMRRSYEKHKEQRIAASMKYKAEHPEVVAKSNADYWNRKRDEINRKRREKRRENAELRRSEKAENNSSGE